MDDVILAKDIHDCESCPLYKYDCIGGWTSDGNGNPVEPPCTSWDDDDEIYEGMYEDRVYEPSEQELRWEREELAQKEQERKKKREAEDKEETRRQIGKATRYGNAKIREGGGLCSDWYCPSCHRWFRAWHESYHNGIIETCCSFCGEPLAHSYLLD
mgnify:CR=1 FL=1